MVVANTKLNIVSVRVNMYLARRKGKGNKSRHLDDAPQHRTRFVLIMACCLSRDDLTGPTNIGI